MLLRAPPPPFDLSSPLQRQRGDYEPRQSAVIVVAVRLRYGVRRPDDSDLRSEDARGRKRHVIKSLLMFLPLLNASQCPLSLFLSPLPPLPPTSVRSPTCSSILVRAHLRSAFLFLSSTPPRPYSYCLTQLVAYFAPLSPLMLLSLNTYIYVFILFQFN